MYSICTSISIPWENNYFNEKDRCKNMQQIAVNELHINF